MDHSLLSIHPLEWLQVLLLLLIGSYVQVLFFIFFNFDVVCYWNWLVARFLTHTVQGDVVVILRWYLVREDSDDAASRRWWRMAICLVDTVRDCKCNCRARVVTELAETRENTTRNVLVIIYMLFTDMYNAAVHRTEWYATADSKPCASIQLLTKRLFCTAAQLRLSVHSSRTRDNVLLTFLRQLWPDRADDAGD